MHKRITRLADVLFRRRTWVVSLFQAILVLCSLVFSWLLWQDFQLGDRHLILVAAPVLLVARLLAIRIFGLQHGWWRYTGVSEAFVVAKAVFVGSLGFFVAMRWGLGFSAFPASIYFMEALVTGVLLLGVRLLSRAFAESVREDWTRASRVLIVGAGFAAQMILREISRPGSSYLAVGCVDDDKSKIGCRILGATVLGTVEDLPSLVEKHAVNEVLIAIPSATSEQMNRFVNYCEKAGVKFRTIPAMKDLLLDSNTMSQVREVNLDDLLGRQPVRIDLESVREQLEGRVVMVTGAAGSIGSEICRQAIGFRPDKLICVDQSETGIFYLNMELTKRNQGTGLVSAVTDIQDSTAMRELLREHSVDIIFHAAAYKHVPLMELNVREAVKNNVFALVDLLDLAQESGCEAFVLISSDKAVNPTSVMGSTKRIGELIVAARPSGKMRCSSVRFGNVLGSSGSLIPILQEQLRKGQPLTITHPDIRRFFMTTQEAVSLVLQASAIGRHGDVLVLDMGESLRILDLAETLIRLSGRDRKSVEIVFTGLREGEKFYEELFYESERVVPTSFEKVKRTEGKITDWNQLERSLSRLEDAVLSGSPDQVRDRIKHIVPEYCYTPNDNYKVARITPSSVA